MGDITDLYRTSFSLDPFEDDEPTICYGKTCNKCGLAGLGWGQVILKGKPVWRLFEGNKEHTCRNFPWRNG